MFETGIDLGLLFVSDILLKMAAAIGNGTNIIGAAYFAILDCRGMRIQSN